MSRIFAFQGIYFKSDMKWASNVLLWLWNKQKDIFEHESGTVSSSIVATRKGAPCHVITCHSTWYIHTLVFSVWIRRIFQIPPPPPPRNRPQGKGRRDWRRLYEQAICLGRTPNGWHRTVKSEYSLLIRYFYVSQRYRGEKESWKFN